MKRPVVLCLASIVLTGLAAAQQPSRAHDSSAASAAKKRVYVDGKPIATNRVIVKDGVAYVETTAIAEALGGSVESGEAGVKVTSPAKPACDGEKTTPEGQRISEPFRAAVANIPDEIESLRATVAKKEKTPLGPRFDEIDHKLSLSEPRVQSDADMAVYYALSYANNSLAIAYYKQSRGVVAEEAMKGQIDSVMCAMESKFALMKGVLLSGNSCSVFERFEAQLPLKPPASTDKE